MREQLVSAVGCLLYPFAKSLLSHHRTIFIGCCCPMIGQFVPLDLFIHWPGMIQTCTQTCALSWCGMLIVLISLVCASGANLPLLSWQRSVHRCESVSLWVSLLTLHWCDILLRVAYPLFFARQSSFSCNSFVYNLQCSMSCSAVIILKSRLIWHQAWSIFLVQQLNKQKIAGLKFGRVARHVKHQVCCRAEDPRYNIFVLSILRIYEELTIVSWKKTVKPDVCHSLNHYKIHRKLPQ